MFEILSFWVSTGILILSWDLGLFVVVVVKWWFKNKCFHIYRSVHGVEPENKHHKNHLALHLFDSRFGVEIRGQTGGTLCLPWQLGNVQHGHREFFTRTSEVPSADSRLWKAVLVSRMATRGRFLVDWILFPRQSLLSMDPGLTTRGEQLLEYHSRLFSSSCHPMKWQSFAAG